MIATVDTARLSFVREAFDKSNTESNFCDIDAKYVIVRDKVCELTMARALCRPLKDKEPRITAIDKSEAVVKTLEGQLPTNLQKLIDSIKPPKA